MLMKSFTIPYGKGCLTFELPDAMEAEVIAPVDVPPVPDPVRAIEAALDTPVGSVSLEGFAGVRSAAIAVNDKTRPVPHEHLLPPLLGRLEALGLPPGAITLLIATGTHAPMTPDEYPAILPAGVIERYEVVSHDARDEANLVGVGESARGTPVWINRRYAEAELRVVVGNVEPHQFAGFSGGVKSAVIGLGGEATANRNHTLLLDPASGLGSYEGNPLRQDIEEMGQMVGVHFALNAVLNRHKQIVRAFAGEPRAVMETAIPVARRFCQVSVAQPFDLVIASPGGHPKDINLYQSQKALAHCEGIVKAGGEVILAASCPEGVGSQVYETWMEGMTSHQEVLARFAREGFRVGVHKAFQVARHCTHARILLVSQMDADRVRRLLLEPAASLEAAVRSAVGRLPAGGRVGVLPWASVTIPRLPAEQEQAGP
jgi:nickel-dependent lactate racemase